MRAIRQRMQNVSLVCNVWAVWVGVGAADGWIVPIRIDCCVAYCSSSPQDVLTSPSPTCLTITGAAQRSQAPSTSSNSSRATTGKIAKGDGSRVCATANGRIAKIVRRMCYVCMWWRKPFAQLFRIWN
ncbi:hypothetical protein BDZ91DRAFT_731040 [Kalaharituber pfeilii]|nr:hypothetical protein BDZ91DRAFT_731040 [Kalaharituber pfeilii]